MKILGDLLFYTILVGLPFVAFYFWYRGKSVGNWFENRQWYEVGMIMFVIIGAVVVYLLLMSVIKLTIFNIAWFKISSWYETKQKSTKSSNSKESVNKTNDKNDQALGVGRDNLRRVGSARNDRGIKQDLLGGDKAEDPNKIRDATDA